MPKRIKLVDVKGATSVYIDASIDEAGNLVFSGQDIGEAPQKYVGDSDYEYWLTVGADKKDLFLLSLLQELFENDIRVMSKVREILEAKGIAFSTHSF